VPQRVRLCCISCNTWRKVTTSTHQSLQRAIAILREFSEQDPALTVSEISRRLGIHKSTVSRILGTLLEEGVVWHNPETGRYSLGMALVEMSGVALGQIDVRAAAMPHMGRLAVETNETITVAVRRRREIVTVVHLASTHSIRHVMWIGRRLPLHTTAAGKALLASMHAHGEDWRALVGMPEDDRPIDWETTLEAELASIANRGYAEDSDEVEIGTAAIAAPVVDHTGEAVAAISISGPSTRFGSEARDTTAPLLIEAANAIAGDLGMQRSAELAGRSQ
jgi:IclR family transcriptional regulator, KDG regulon repressor